jgi:hypothetical protein
MRRRQIAIVLAVSSIVGILALSSVACGGGGGSSDATGSPTHEARTTCKPPANATPGNYDSIPQGMTEYRSPERGYRVLYPADWRAKANTVAVANIAGDVFFSNDTVGTITPNISVTCETVPIGTTSGDFIDSKRTVTQRLTGSLPDIEMTLAVNGQNAASVMYSMRVNSTPEPVTIEKVDVYFADDLGGWTISLTAPADGVDTYRPSFDALVQSYARP